MSFKVMFKKGKETGFVVTADGGMRPAKFTFEETDLGTLMEVSTDVEQLASNNGSTKYRKWKGGPRKKLTDEAARHLSEHLHALLELGVSVQQISDKLECSTQFVYKIKNSDSDSIHPALEQAILTLVPEDFAHV